jgi:hypothetical protein
MTMNSATPGETGTPPPPRDTPDGTAAGGSLLGAGAVTIPRRFRAAVLFAYLAKSLIALLLPIFLVANILLVSSSEFASAQYFQGSLLLLSFLTFCGWLLLFLPLFFLTRRFLVCRWHRAALVGALVGVGEGLVMLTQVSEIRIAWPLMGFGLAGGMQFALGSCLKKTSRHVLWITALACGVLAAPLLWAWHRAELPPKIRLLTNPRREVVVGAAIPIDQVGVPTEWPPNAKASDTTERVVLEFHLDLTNCVIVPISGGYDYLKVAGLEPFSNEYEPMLPMRSYRVELNGDARFLRAKVTAGTFHEVAGEVNVGSIRPHERNQLRIRDPDAFFPGRLIECDGGQARGKRVVYVRFFPVQYLPRKRQVRLVTSAVIVLECGGDASKAPSSTPLAAQSGSKTLPSVIVCPAALAEPARHLAEFHEREDRLPTAVVTTEFIKEHYAEAPYPPLRGIGSPPYQVSKSVLTNYDASLARKIVAYLRDDAAHPDLGCVTLLGNGSLVPPSYYAYVSDEFHETFFDRWIPTDYFYASPDHDWVADFAVGRLPVKNRSEAEALVTKIIAWRTQTNWSWFANAALVGAEQRSGWRHSGDACLNYYASQGSFEAYKQKRYFVGDGPLTEDKVAPLMTKGGSGLVCISAHGTPGFVDLDQGGKLTTSQILAAEPTTQTPIVVANACSCAAYDLTVMQAHDPVSVGEAVLLSQAGGIAFFGFSRIASTDSFYFFEEGNQRIERFLGSKLLFGQLLQRLSLGGVTLGQVWLDTANSFVENSAWSRDWYASRMNLWMFELLGDPALCLPSLAAPRPHKAARIVCRALAPKAFDHRNIPIYERPPIRIEVTSDPAMKAWKLFDSQQGALLQSGSFPQPVTNHTFTFECRAACIYLLRTIAEDDVEGWFYFRIGEVPSS